MYRSSIQKDKKYNRYDPNNHVDKRCLRYLIEKYPKCNYQDCNIKLQYLNYASDLASLERLHNSKNHS